MLEIIRKNTLFILCVTLLCAGVAYLSTSFTKSGIEQQQTVFLKVENTSTNTQKVDLQALTDTTVATISSPDFQGPMPPESFITVKKLAPQVILISSISPSTQESRQIIETVVGKFNTLSPSLIHDANAQIDYLGEPQKPQEKIFNNKLLAIFGAISGFVIALAVIIISKYFKL